MRKRISKRRGRPRGKYRSSADFRLLRYLALVSMKFGVDPEKFFDGFVEAWRRQEFTCKNLLIECRKRTRDYAVFLITNGFKVVAQFRVPKRILEETSPLKKFVSAKAARRTIHERIKIEHPRIGDLKFGMNRVNLKARVIEIPKPKSVFTRFGNSALVTNVKVKDETGIIQLPMWNRQIDTVSVGDTIQVENARVVTFRGERQLKVGRGGRLSVIKKK